MLVPRQMQNKLIYNNFYFLFEKVGTGQPESTVRRRLLIVCHFIIFDTFLCIIKIINFKN